MKTPFETEIKIAAESAQKARAVLRLHGFSVIRPRVFESNIVLDDKARSLRKRGLLLRIRVAGKDCTCTYKGRELAGPHKRREEREFRVSDFDAFLAVAGALGYRESFRYEKYRTEFARAKEPGHATLDETPIGVYLELEGPARWINQTAKRLGYARGNWVTASYASLYIDWCRDRGVKPSNMIFRPV